MAPTGINSGCWWPNTVCMSSDAGAIGPICQFCMCAWRSSDWYISGSLANDAFQVSFALENVCTTPHYFCYAMLVFFFRSLFQTHRIIIANAFLLPLHWNSLLRHENSNYWNNNKNRLCRACHLRRRGFFSQACCFFISRDKLCNGRDAHLVEGKKSALRAVTWKDVLMPPPIRIAADSLRVAFWMHLQNEMVK